MHHLNHFAILGLGNTEIVVVLVLVLLLFGARKLPELAHSMGASINSFKKGMKAGTEDVAKPDDKPASDKPSNNGSH
mgnify:CR=1 FL=1|jgi:sec-independent protein translocase protein TatA